MEILLVIFGIVYFLGLILVVRESWKLNKRVLLRWRFVILIVIWPVVACELVFQYIRHFVLSRQ